MIRLTEAKDIPNIKKLWQEVFDEDSKICELFFNSVFPFCRGVVCDGDNGDIYSSLFLIPCRLGEFHGLCVYCAMTAESHRGKGIMQSLLNFSDEYRKGADLDFLFLVPAEKSLFNYYKSCGYTPCGVKQTAVIRSNEPLSSFTADITPEEYISRREKAVFSISHISFDDRTVKYWANACRHYGGRIIACGDASALMFADGDSVILRDVTGSDECIKALISSLDGQITIEGYSLPLENVEAIPCGMVKTDNMQILNGNYYIGITLE